MNIVIFRNAELKTAFFPAPWPAENGKRASPYQYLPIAVRQKNDAADNPPPTASNKAFEWLKMFRIWLQTLEVGHVRLLFYKGHFI